MIIEIDSAVVERLIIAELVGGLGVLVLMPHEDEPFDTPFVRMHHMVESPRTGRPDDHDTRAAVVRVTAQTTEAALRADGWALRALAQQVKAALAGKTLAAGVHRVQIDGGAVTITGDEESLMVRDAQVTFRAMVERVG